MTFEYPTASAAGIKERLGAYGLTPNKALGQNFLASMHALDAIVACVDENANVLEIGPGLGALTEALLARGCRVAAIEKDAAMADALRAMLPAKTLLLRTEDFLCTDLAAQHAYFHDEPFHIVGNLPYYITTPIAQRALSCTLPLASILFMLQKEAAARFFSRPGDKTYGPLAVAAQHAYTIREVCALTPAAFYPQPDVHAAVLQLLPKADTAVEPGFLPFLGGVFAMRRKTIRNNLSKLGYTQAAISSLLEAANVPAQARAQELPVFMLYLLYKRAAQLGRPYALQ